MKDSNYNKLIIELTRQFEKSIPDDEKDKAELVNQFKNYMEKERDNASRNIVVRSSSYLMEKMLRSKANQLIETDIITKKKSLLKDENFEELMQRSIQAFEIAKKTLLAGDRVVKEINSVELIEEVKELRDSVRDFNQKDARAICSETILDINLMACPGANMVSLRIADMFMGMPRSKRKQLRAKAEANQKKYSKEIKQEYEQWKKERSYVEGGEER